MGKSTSVFCQCNVLKAIGKRRSSQGRASSPHGLVPFARVLLNWLRTAGQAGTGRSQERRNASGHWTSRFLSAMVDGQARWLKEESSGASFGECQSFRATSLRPGRSRGPPDLGISLCETLGCCEVRNEAPSHIRSPEGGGRVLSCRARPHERHFMAGSTTHPPPGAGLEASLTGEDPDLPRFSPEVQNLQAHLRGVLDCT